MPEKKEQTMFFSDDEIALIKSVFAENDTLLKAMRKFFLQFPLTEWEEKIISGIKGQNNTTKLLRKIILPTLDLDVPIGQMKDPWLNIDLKQGKKEEVDRMVIARQTYIKYFDWQLNALEFNDKYKFEINFSSLIKGEVSDVMAHQMIATQVEGLLLTLKGIAGQKEETAEEQMKRLEKNSNK